MFVYDVNVCCGKMQPVGVNLKYGADCADETTTLQMITITARHYGGWFMAFTRRLFVFTILHRFLVCTPSGVLDNNAEYST